MSYHQRKSRFTDTARASDSDGAIGRQQIQEAPRGGIAADQSRLVERQIVAHLPRGRRRPAKIGGGRGSLQQGFPRPKQPITAAGGSAKQVSVGTERFAHR